MPRARETWGQLRARIREHIRETDETDPYWTSSLLLNLFNEALDERFMQLASADEGWSIDEFVADLVAQQREYTMPVGADRVRKVKLVDSSGGIVTEIVVGRDEHVFDSVTHGGSANSIANGAYLPTYRLAGELLLLEPRPGASVVGGLHVDYEAPPPKMASGDSSTLPQRFPLVMETLLVLDTAVAAMTNEDAQAEIDPRVSVGRLERRRNRYESIFLEFIESRQATPTFSRRVPRGD